MTNEPVYDATPVYPEIAIKRPPNHEQCAKEKYNLPDAWQPVGWERKNFDTPNEYLLVMGGVYPEKFKSGPRKGKTNYRKPVAGSYCELPVTDADHKAWLLVWEAETGLCSKCKGSGWEWRGWSSIKGTAHRRCPKCDAIGIAKKAEIAA